MTTYNSIPTIEGKIKDLERRVSTAETAPRLSSSGVGSGGITINDGGSLTIKDGGSLSVTGDTEIGGVLNVGADMNITGELTVGGASSLQSTLTVDEEGDIVVRGGRVIVRNSDDEDLVRIGSLPSGGYGIEQSTGDHWIPLLQLARGPRSASDPSIFELNTPADTGSAWEFPGPSVDFTTYTGSLTILVSSNVMWYGYKSGVTLSYRIRKLDGTVVIPADGNRGAVLSNPSNLDANQTAVCVSNQSIDPGEYTIDVGYQVGAGISEAVYASFYSRSIMVFPY